MKAKPIIFSGPMVRALMRTENPKTMTRRVMTPQPEWPVGCYRYDGLQDGVPAVELLKDGEPTEKYFPCPSPRYEVGDIIYVREAFRLVDFEYVDDDWNASVKYRADGAIGPRLHYLKNGADERTGWRPSIHMPRAAARNFLLVTAVRPERLQGITVEDCIAEGVKLRWSESMFKPGWNIYTYAEKIVIPAYIAAFADLWDSFNAKRGHGWAKNDWIWAYTFERVEKPADWEA
jgi:hypothetical protein